MKRNKSAEKKARQSERRRLENKAVKSKLKSTLKRTTGENLSTAYSVIDRAAKKAIIHKNTAARMKSRLAVRMNKKEKAETPPQK